MRKPVVLITGAGGEIGHGLIERLAERSRRAIVTLDLTRLDPASPRWSIARSPARSSTAPLLERILAEFEVDLVFHLAALLSTRSEFTPVTAHQVNVEGTLNLLEFAQHEGESHGRPGRLHVPVVHRRLRPARSRRRRRAPAGSRKTTGTHPTTMYGCNKLYCEQLGHYYARHYKQLAAEPASGRVDFRCVRFPGLISAVTMPSGGTSDYAPEMIHAAAEGRALRLLRPAGHAHPVHGDARRRRRAPARWRPRRASALTRTAYNVGAFNPSAEEIRDVVLRAFPDAEITWKVDAKRQGIVDSWPADVDDGAARRDWGFAPRYDFDARVPRVPDSDDPRRATRDERAAASREHVAQAARGMSHVSTHSGGGLISGAGVGPGSGRPLPVEAADRAHGHVVVAENLAGQPDAGDALGGEHAAARRRSSSPARRSTNSTRQVVQRALPPHACRMSTPASCSIASTSRFPFDLDGAEPFNRQLRHVRSS